MEMFYSAQQAEERDAIISKAVDQWAAEKLTPELREQLKKQLETGNQSAMPNLGIGIEITPREATALGGEATLFVGWLTTALSALVALRTGRVNASIDPDASNEAHSDAEVDPLVAPSAGWWYWPINDLDHRMIVRLQGIRDAAIREHAACGGTYGHLALAMDVERSTAQYRRDRLMSSEPSTWEDWARNGGPQHVICDGCKTEQATVRARFTRATGDPTTMDLCPACEQQRTLHIPQGDMVSIRVIPLPQHSEK